MNTKLILNILLVSLLTIFVLSCEKTIEFDDSETASKIVVNAVFYANSKYKYVKVEKSRSILDDRRFFEALPNATVNLYEDNEFISELSYRSEIDTFYDHLEYDVVKMYPYEKGIYIDSLHVVKPGSVYRLEVFADGFDPVHCETKVPQPVELGSMELEMLRTPNQYNENLFQLKMKLPIRDPQNESNYYRLNMRKKIGIEAALKNFSGYRNSGSGGGQSPYNNPVIDLDSIEPTDTIIMEYGYNHFVQSLDPVLNATGSTDILNNGDKPIEFFNDELINSSEYELTFWDETYRDVYTDFGEFLEMNVTIAHLSEELYRYTLSRQQQEIVSGNPFAEPVPVYSNVVGGLGIFGSQAFNGSAALIGEYPVEGKVYVDRNEYYRRYYEYQE